MCVVGQFTEHLTFTVGTDQVGQENKNKTKMSKEPSQKIRCFSLYSNSDRFRLPHCFFICYVTKSK